MAENKKGIFDLIDVAVERHKVKTGDKPTILFLGRNAGGALARSLSGNGPVRPVDQGYYEGMKIHIMSTGPLDMVDVG